MQIDFKEIPEVKKATEHIDSFEKFARDFLEIRGFDIETEPSRGADGGIDIKVLEKRTGLTGTTNFYWLVSCKHNAHSGKSVGVRDEVDIQDRVLSNSCDGFIGFYSTIPSSGLINKLESLKEKIPYLIFDNEKIESNIIGIFSMESIFMRYFPKSYKNWRSLYFYYEPVELVKYYIEKNYDKEMVMNSIFGSIGTLIKYTRKYEKFSTAIDNTDFTLKKIKINLDRVLYEPCIIKTVIKETVKVDDFQDSLFAFCSICSRVGDGFLIIYDKYLIISEDYYKYLKSIFYDLKNMLK